MSKMYPISEAADMLGVTSNTLRRMCDDKEISFYRIGTHRRFSDLQLNEYLLGRVVNAKSE